MSHFKSFAFQRGNGGDNFGEMMIPWIRMPCHGQLERGQIQMTIQQMEVETMSNNPDMMKQMPEQMKGMKAEDIEKTRLNATVGTPPDIHK